MTWYHKEVLKLRDALHPDPVACGMLMQAKALMERCYAEPLRLEQLASAACLSPFHFHRRFKVFYGRTPLQLLTDIRMREAKKRLRQGRPVLQTCFEVGYESPTSFAAAFRRYGGRPPAAWRHEKSKMEEVR